MRKARISIMILLGTVLISITMLIGTFENDCVEAPVIMTTRRDIYQKIGLEGQLSYSDEALIRAEVPGVIEYIDVYPGLRVSSGDIVARLNTNIHDQMIGEYLSKAEILDVNPEGATGVIAAVMNTSIVRALNNGIVREIYAKEGEHITSGMPIARISSNQQEIRCIAVQQDAEQILNGMWASIFKDQELVGKGTVTSIAEMTSDDSRRCFLITIKPDKYIGVEENDVLYVEVILSGGYQVVSLPINAISADETVWWVNEGRCTEIPAEIVMCDEMHAWVNLPEGIKVAVGEFMEGMLISEASE